MLRVQGFPRKSSRFAVASWPTLIQSLYVSPGHLSLVYQQNLRGSIQQIAFRMASLNLITFAHMNEAFFFENPHEKNAFFISLRISMQPKKSILRSTWNRCTFKKKRGKHLSWHHWHYQRIGSFLVQFHIHRSTSKFADPHQKRSSTVSAGWHDLILRLFASCFLYM